MYKKRGSGVSVNGASFNPQYCSYILYPAWATGPRYFYRQDTNETLGQSLSSPPKNSHESFPISIDTGQKSRCYRSGGIIFFFSPPNDIPLYSSLYFASAFSYSSLIPFGNASKLSYRTLGEEGSSHCKDDFQNFPT